MAVHESRIEEGITAAEAVLADPQAPEAGSRVRGVRRADWQMPVAGRGDEFEPYAARCRAEQAVHRRHESG